MQLNKEFLDSFPDQEILQFVQTQHAMQLAGHENFPDYVFDVDDNGEDVKHVKIKHLDQTFEYSRKVYPRKDVISVENGRTVYARGLNSVRTDIFSFAYPLINEAIIETGDLEESRNGNTREFLNFKTEITRPYLRCSGGYNRNINIFFLLAEALWIWAGKDDVAFLTIFNKGMADFSDDGVTFHAPYGHRMRYCDSGDKQYPIDQIKEALQMLEQNSQDRRVVVSIWDAKKDLARKSKDIPCNDMVMFKIRKNRLFTTIQNRSNDLHWGLPTNVFQFSFVSEVMAKILGVGIGNQVHNSQSLHIYTNNPIADTMYQSRRQNGDKTSKNLYEVAKGTLEFDFNFNPIYKTTSAKLKRVDGMINAVINLVAKVHAGTIDYQTYSDLLDMIKQESIFLAYTLQLLVVYCEYTKTTRAEQDKLDAILKIQDLNKTYPAAKDTDYEFLAINFFAARLKDKAGIQKLNPVYGTL